MEIDANGGRRNFAFSSSVRLVLEQAFSILDATTRLFANADAVFEGKSMFTGCIFAVVDSGLNHC